MIFELPPLPFAKDALQPYLSEETIDYHYGKHHQAYVTNLNKLIVGTPFENKTLDEIVMTASGGIFNNAGQHWNHSFYWNCLGAQSRQTISKELKSALQEAFGSFEKFKEKFAAEAVSLFGSGWTWLVCDKAGKLKILNTSNAGNPIVEGHKPLFVCDVWEHAYYIDCRNLRAKYLEAFWQVVNWEFVHKNLFSS